jgi:hypothetical protein
MGLINQHKVLEREVLSGKHTIGWMGFDAGWKHEIKSRWGDLAGNQIILYEAIRSLDMKVWEELGFALKSEGVTLFILDHLYGMAGVLGLNDANQVAQLTNLLRPIYEKFGVPVLLIAQAAKGELSRGRAAHSVALEGEARALVRLFEKRPNGSRKIELSSNTRGEEILSIVLNERELTFKESKIKDSSESRHRESPDLVRNFLSKADADNLNSWAAAGRELCRLGFSKTDNAGRSMANRLRNQSLLMELNGKIVAGNSLLELPIAIDDYAGRNAS